MSNLHPVLASERHLELREMYHEKFSALEAPVIENALGKMTYPDKSALKVYMKLRKLDEHVRLADDIAREV